MQIDTADSDASRWNDDRTFGRSVMRRVAATRLVSVTGSQAAQTALLLDLFTRTGSATWVSVAAFASVGVLGLVSPFAGAVADRQDRRRVMIVAELAGALIYLSLLLPIGAAATVALVLVGTALNAPVRAASAALVPTVIRPDDLTWANGLLTGSFSTGLLAGPVLGGALTAAFGPSAVYAVNGLTFVISAAVLAVTLPRSGRTDSARHADSGSLLAGVAYLVRQPQLRLLSAGSVFLFLGFGLTSVTDLPLAASFHAGPVGFGLLAALWGAGSLTGSLVCSSWCRPGQERLVSAGGCVAMAIGLGAVAVLPSFPAVLVASAVGDSAVDWPFRRGPHCCRPSPPPPSGVGCSLPATPSSSPRTPSGRSWRRRSSPPSTSVRRISSSAAWPPSRLPACTGRPAPPLHPIHPSPAHRGKRHESPHDRRRNCSGTELVRNRRLLARPWNGGSR